MRAHVWGEIGGRAGPSAELPVLLRAYGLRGGGWELDLANNPFGCVVFTVLVSLQNKKKRGARKRDTPK